MNSALTLNGTKRQWVDLGIQTGVCMAKPETCGVAGGAIGFWVKVIKCSSLGGVISTATHGTAGSQIYCTSGYDFDTNSRFRIWTEQRARRLILISILMLV